MRYFWLSRLLFFNVFALHNTVCCKSTFFTFLLKKYVQISPLKLLIVVLYVVFSKNWISLFCIFWPIFCCWLLYEIAICYGGLEGLLWALQNYDTAKKIVWWNLEFCVAENKSYIPIVESSMFLASFKNRCPEIVILLKFYFNIFNIHLL